MGIARGIHHLLPLALVAFYLVHSEINYEHILCSCSVVQQLIACLANLMVFHQAAAARWDARCGHRRFHGRDTPTDGDACGCRHKGRDDEANLTCS